MTTDHPHFEGKTAIEHLKAAREKGNQAQGELHGSESSGSFIAGIDSLKETTIVLIGITIVLLGIGLPSQQIGWSLAIFSFGWLLWKIARSSLLGWSRLERVHRLIEQERFEIEHHRKQEKEELNDMYRQKGFSGKLLDEVIEVLMADDNRLLKVMLEEELGLTLEAYEHPLKQGFGAGVGVLLAILGLGLGFLVAGETGWILGGLIPFLLATFLSTKKTGNELAKSLVWNGAVFSLSLGSVYFLTLWIVR